MNNNWKHSPFVSLKNDSKFSGYEIEILKVLSGVFNFTYSFIDCHRDWGTLLANGTWTGIIEQLHQNVSVKIKIIELNNDNNNSIFQQADIGLGELSLTNERLKSVQFLYPYVIETVTFMATPPKSLKNIGFIYKVFEPSIWVSIISSLIILLIVILLDKIQYKSNKHLNYIWNVIEVVLNQNLNLKTPCTNQILIVFYSWVLSCFYLRLFYSNCIYTLMVLPNKVDTIDSIFDLYQAQIMDKITVVMRSGTSYLIYLKVST